MQNFIVDTDERPRLDSFVNNKLPSLSRAYIQKLLKLKKINVNDEVVKSGYKVRPGDRINVDVDMDQIVTIPKIKIPIIYEDEDALVINKPLGVLSHSKGAFNPEATVETFIQDKIQFDNNDRAGIVHRLDRPTSGVMICAKNQAALLWLQKQFSTRKAKKTYIAVVYGHLKQKEAIIDMPIGRNPKMPAFFKVHANGKPSITAYKVLNESQHYSIIELKPTTGRTHQLRVHLSHIGHPIVGDTFYNGKPAQRLYLHAESLELTLPNQVRSIFSAKLPKEFNQLLKDDNA